MKLRQSLPAQMSVIPVPMKKYCYFCFDSAVDLLLLLLSLSITLTVR